MGDISQKPVFEGIDKIKIMLQPYLVYYLDSSKIIRTNPKRREQWYNSAQKYLDFYVKYIRFNQYLYLLFMVSILIYRKI
jgi:hypothetical protein